MYSHEAQEFSTMDFDRFVHSSPSIIMNITVMISIRHLNCYLISFWLRYWDITPD